MSEHDRLFFKNFSIIIVILAVTTVLLILYAMHLNDSLARDENPNLTEMANDRIREVGDVYTSDTPRPVVAVAEAAYGGTLDGEEIYGKVCQACHTAGIAGSPTLELAAWTDRIAQGQETLVKHAVEGYQGSAGFMPPKGGKMDLSEEQVAVTVAWMLDNLK